jgi:predicted O-methyltransferase YrrM
MDIQFVDNILGVPDRFTKDHGWLLYGLARSFRPRVIVETGSCFGYFTCFLARAALDIGAKFYTIDYFQGEAPHTGPDDIKVFWENLDCCGVKEGVTELIVDDAIIALKNLAAQGKFNNLGMVVLDDIHLYDRVTEEIDICWPYLLDGGIIGGHDCYWHDFAGVNKAYIEATSKYKAKSIWSYNSLGFCFLQKNKAEGDVVPSHYTSSVFGEPYTFSI